MCLFSWGGKKPLLEIYPQHWLQRASGVSSYFLPGCAGVNTVCYQRMALILFYDFKKIEQKNYCQTLGSVFGKKWTEMTFLCKAEDTAHALFSILHGLFFFCCLWDLNGECMQLAGKLPKQGCMMIWHKEIWCGNQQSQPGTLLRSRWANTSSAELMATFRAKTRDG